MVYISIIDVITKTKLLELNYLNLVVLRLRSRIIEADLILIMSGFFITPLGRDLFKTEPAING